MDTFALFVQADEFEEPISQEEIDEVLREMYEEEMRNAPRWEDLS